MALGQTAPPETSPAYRSFPLLGSRLAVWGAAQLHLNFAAFILGVPIFAVIVEFVGWRTREPRYDWLAHEFMKLTFAAFSATALLGGALTFFLLTLYPRFFGYLAGIFGPTMWVYAGLFFLETFTLYLYYYGWDWLSGSRKGIHLLLGVLLNLWGTALLFVANSWVTFMVSPRGVDEAGTLTSLWAAIDNYTWMPINVHRLIANVTFGGAIAGAYAAFRFLGATSDEERARYDWMGYIGNFVALSSLLFLPFAGYWLGREIYAFSQTMGITMMGGFMSWLWVVQAMLIGVLFLGSNYYLWLGMERIPGSERYRKFIPYMLMVLAAGFMVWATPRSMVVTLEESRAMGGAHHPVLGRAGRDVGQEYGRQPDDSHHVPFVPALPAGQQGLGEAVGEDRHDHSRSVFRGGRRGRHLLRSLRLLRRVHRQDRILGLPGPGRLGSHRGDHGD